MPNISELIQEKSARDETWRAERQAERESLSEMRNAALEEITTNPETYLKYLKLQADNIACSPGNTALAMFQLKTASLIGPKDFWQKQGRYVRDDELNKGAKVFASQQQSRRWYPIGDYYDVSQTAGKDLQKTIALSPDNPQSSKALATLMNYSPVPVIEDKSLTVPARYDETNINLAVNSDCTEQAVFSALADEIMYARMHSKGRNPHFDRESYRLDAESIGYMLCRRFGVAHPEPDAGALAQLPLLYDGYDPQDRGNALKSLCDTARSIGDRIDKSIRPVQQDRAFKYRSTR